MDEFLVLVTIVAIPAIYLGPTWIAFGRRHHQRAAILALNLLFGWTFIGWAAALIWALTAVKTADVSSM